VAVAHGHAGSSIGIVFIHGGAGSPRSWRKFPSILEEVLEEEPGLGRFRIFNFGYPCGLIHPFPKWFRADPDLSGLAGLFRTYLEVDLRAYRRLAIIAHSLGGLITQLCMVDHPAIAERVEHVVQFGVSSAGFQKLGLERRMPALPDITPDSEVLAALRRRWDETFGSPPESFTFHTVAGATDAWVPMSSSLKPFHPDCQRVIHGDHWGIIRPRDRNATAVRIVVHALTDRRPPPDASAGGGADRGAGGVNVVPITRAAAAPAGGGIRTRGGVTGRGPGPRHEREPAGQAYLTDEELRRRRIANLVLAGDPDAALEQLDAQPESAAGGDRAGALRDVSATLLQAWSDEDDGQRSGAPVQQFFEAGLEREEQGGDAASAALHAINLAYLQLVLDRDPDAARRAADTALTRATHADATRWNLALAADAALILGRHGQAWGLYEQAVRADAAADASEGASLLERGFQIAGLVGDRTLFERLEALQALAEPRHGAMPEET